MEGRFHINESYDVNGFTGAGFSYQTENLREEWLCGKGDDGEIWYRCFSDNGSEVLFDWEGHDLSLLTRVLEETENSPMHKNVHFAGSIEIFRILLEDNPKWHSEQSVGLKLLTRPLDALPASRRQTKRQYDIHSNTLLSKLGEMKEIVLAHSTSP